ncbi:MAG: hypothetical protein IPJ77_08120 [Planctomycetes bacterium]|nr:hypothetical protein [Planctomycetota bacterium]
MEPTDETRAALRRSLARGDRLHVAHLVLVATMAVWRGALATPALAADQGATWTSSPLGRALALASVLVGVAALAVAVATTLKLRTDRAAWALLAAMVLALAWRERVDVFDLVYGALALALGAYWFRERRGALAEAVLERAPISPRA